MSTTQTVVRSVAFAAAATKRQGGGEDAGRIEQSWGQLVAIIGRTPQNAGLR